MTSEAAGTRSASVRLHRHLGIAAWDRVSSWEATLAAAYPVLRSQPSLSSAFLKLVCGDFVGEKESVEERMFLAPAGPRPLSMCIFWAIKWYDEALSWSVPASLLLTDL